MIFVGWLKEFCLISLRHGELWEAWEQSSKKATALRVQKGQEQKKSIYFAVKKIKVRDNENVLNGKTRQLLQKKETGGDGICFLGAP